MSKLNASQTLQTATTTLTPAPSGILQRKCASCGNHTIAGGKCDDCENKKGVLQRKSSNNSEQSEVPPIVHEVLNSSGQPLDKTTRAFFEPRFAHDFSKVPVSSTSQQLSQSSLTVGEPADVYEQQADRVADSIMLKEKPENKTLSTNEQQDEKFDLSRVRVHTDARAAESARAVNALAYTVGRDIVFAAGQYQPTKESGKRLLAHELTHVAQQSAKSFSNMSTVQRQPAAPVPAAAPANGGLNEEMLRQIARVLHEAMSGPGTDEEAIYSAFAGRNQEQVDAIARVYQEMYDVDLLTALKGELNDSEMMHLAIFSLTSVPGEPGSEKQNTAFADMIALQLRNAMTGLGTDEESIYAALTGRTTDELRAIKDAYARLTKRDLAADIEDEMSGTELTRAKALLSQGMLMPEDEIYLAVQGLGTDEETLFRVLESVRGDRARITALIDRYAAKGYGNLLEDVRGDLSNIFGDDLSKSMEALHGQTPTGACSTSQRKEALEAISVSVSLTQNAVARADADISAGILSGAVERALKDNFNPGNAANAVHIALLRQVRDRLSVVRNNILTASDVTCLVSDPRFCVANPDCTQRYTYGWAGVNVAAGTVRLCKAFFECMKDENQRGRGLIHEFTHRTGINDKFYLGVEGFSTLTPQGNQSATDSLDNADSYAHFAEQLR